MFPIQLILILILGFSSQVSALFDSETWMTGDVYINNRQASLFYYLFKSRKVENRDKQLIIWLSGGPGCSSMYALMSENGPYLFDKNYNIVYNRYSWNEDYDLMFMDQPVGTGYSQLFNDSQYCKDQKCVAKNFYEFLLNFVTIHHPEYAGVPITITGESYAGHYIPAISEYLLKAGNPLINLAAIAIGNGLTDLEVQLRGNPLYVKENKQVEGLKLFAANSISMLCSVGALYRNLLSDAICLMGIGFIAELAGIINLYHINSTDTYEEIVAYQSKFMNDTYVQKAFGIENWRPIRGLCDPIVNNRMNNDICTPITDSIAYTLDKGIHVLLYYGDLDYICNWRGGEHLADSIKWKGQNEYKKIKYKDFEYNNKTCAKYKKQDNLIYMVVLNAGHLVPTDQPEVSLYMLREFMGKRIE